MSLGQLVRRCSSSPWLALVNGLLCAGAVVANAHHQVFCRPVPWAAVVLILVFTPVVLLPVLRGKPQRWNAALFVLLGIAACICVYCIVFLREMNLGGLAMAIGTVDALISAMPGRLPVPNAGILVYVPHFLLLQIILFAFRTPGKPFRRSFAAGVGLCAVYAVTMAVWFNLHYAAARAAWTNGDTTGIPRNYMTERMLGMHFKYHLSFCGFDGWRPPLHDPSIVVAVWLTAPFRSDLRYDGLMPGKYTWTYHLKERIAAYKAVFPGNAIRQDCSCAKGYSKRYRNDPILR